ncbi:uncharacterized protein LOC125042711 [Penaeus chinensis]|uniref:uncharacterized protein LOC125042711 n=1 Tax=Penaeus chinensis TaxID=139456 RepID=UPI001FB71376|nr:uncharacterized protein LOC125042711 [Penaeus chinensis]
MTRDQERRRNERFQQRRNLRSNSQPSSRDPSPAGAASELHLLPVVAGGSNPEVRQAVQVMATEITMFREVLDRVNALVDEIREYKEQNNQLDARLQRQEENLREKEVADVETRRRQAEERVEDERQQQDALAERDEQIRQLHQQLQERNGELDNARRPQREIQPTEQERMNVGRQQREAVDDRDQQIQQLRNQLQEREGELTELRRNQNTATTPSQRQRSTGDLNSRISCGRHTSTLADFHLPREPPQPLPRSRAQTPEPVCRLPLLQPHPQQHLRQVSPQLPIPEVGRRSTDQMPHCRDCTSLRCPSAQTSSTAPVSYVFTKEKVPLFKGDATASQPLKKNQEIEGWIRAIENVVKPSTSEAYIQAVRANCRGPAELIINSPLFDHIREWETFKAALRSKFRGTYTAADFYKVLYENRMTPGQAPMDYFLQLEGSVYQGYRDHREAIGDPAELVRRIFLSGIPSWLRDFLALKEDGSPTQIAEAAQRIWNSRNGIRHSESSSSQEFQRSPDRPPRVRDHYAMPISVDSPVSAFPVAVQGKWCSYHQVATHNSSDCRALSTTNSSAQPSSNRLCYQCKRPGHFARDCPFQPCQGDSAPRATGRTSPGSYQHSSGGHQNNSHSDVSRTCWTTTRGTQC